MKSVGPCGPGVPVGQVFQVIAVGPGDPGDPIGSGDPGNLVCPKVHSPKHTF